MVNKVAIVQFAGETEKILIKDFKKSSKCQNLCKEALTSNKFTLHNFWKSQSDSYDWARHAFFLTKALLKLKTWLNSH